jgi:hypothetical protein
MKRGDLAQVTNSSHDKELHPEELKQQELLKKKGLIDLGKHSPNHQVICFDLQKTLPTPVLTCYKVYYL